MASKELEQKIKDYFISNKNKSVVWSKVCLDLKIPADEEEALLHDLSERGFIETQVISLVRIIISLSTGCSAMAKLNSPVYQGFSGNTIGNNFSGNTIIIGKKNKNKITSEFSNTQKQRIFTTPGKLNKNSFYKLVTKYWWAIIMSIIAGMLLLLIEYNFFVK